MSNKHKAISLKAKFQSNRAQDVTGHIPEKFFKECIASAKTYDRAAGYFSSTVLELFTSEYYDFAKRGGKIRIVCSYQLSAEDAKVLLVNSFDSENVEYGIVQQVESLDANTKTSNALSFFATLLSEKILEIKIAQTSAGGLFHDKTGCFTDEENNSISFRGSANETFSGWSAHGNFETLEVFYSWDERDTHRVQNHQLYLKKLWNNDTPGLRIESISKEVASLICQKAKKNLSYWEGAIQTPNRLSDRTLEKRTERRVLLDYQEETLKDWRSKDFSGIIKHATGSGKTVTAIMALEDHINEGYPAIVCVPSVLLLEQWVNEIKKDIPDALILKCGGGNDGWRKNNRINALTSAVGEHIGVIIVGVLDTVLKSDFLDQLPNDNNRILLVADEMHTLGRRSAQALLDYPFRKKLGLSATPSRYRDDVGTERLNNFFKHILKPEISINDAINADRLVSYNYHPIAVNLMPYELENWLKLTKSIRRLSAQMKENEKGSSEALEKLLIRRARIAKKAENKISTAVDIIKDNYNTGESWLIYCEDTEQLQTLNHALLDIGLRANMYLSDEKLAKAEELSDFITSGGILLSIRCLDEGVDIPHITHALILASSQNPRQFIQRRGRVLRKSNNKHRADIFDLLVECPDSEVDDTNKLLIAEMERAAEFSSYALNKMSALSTLRNMLIKSGVSPDIIADNERKN